MAERPRGSPQHPHGHPWAWTSRVRGLDHVRPPPGHGPLWWLRRGLGIAGRFASVRTTRGPFLLALGSPESSRQHHLLTPVGPQAASRPGHLSDCRVGLTEGAGVPRMTLPPGRPPQPRPWNVRAALWEGSCSRHRSLGFHHSGAVTSCTGTTMPRTCPWCCRQGQGSGELGTQPRLPLREAQKVCKDREGTSAPPSPPPDMLKEYTTTVIHGPASVTSRQRNQIYRPPPRNNKGRGTENKRK